jgi:hypothetical protein
MQCRQYLLNLEAKDIYYSGAIPGHCKWQQPHRMLAVRQPENTQSNASNYTNHISKRNGKQLGATI